MARNLALMLHCLCVIKFSLIIFPHRADFHALQFLQTISKAHAHVRQDLWLDSTSLAGHSSGSSNSIVRL